MRLWKTRLKHESQLLERANALMGLTALQLALQFGLTIPSLPLQRKGWFGQAIELALGASAGSRPIPDFLSLGVELKTIPLNHRQLPQESTFVTTISLLTIHEETWLTSQCYSKLKRVLWVPVEASPSIPFQHRRIGKPVLWSPNPLDEQSLMKDWMELTLLITSGRIAEIDGRLGDSLQIRPKGANAKALCEAFDEKGNRIKTLPRGFYLRPGFTAKVLNGASLD